MKKKKEKEKSVPPRCKGRLETERNMWYVSETRVMTSLGVTLLENNVMEAGCVMSSYRHSIWTLEKAGEKKSIPMYFLMYCKLHYNLLALYWCKVSTWFKYSPDLCVNNLQYVETNFPGITSKSSIIPHRL